MGVIKNGNFRGARAPPFEKKSPHIHHQELAFIGSMTKIVVINDRCFVIFSRIFSFQKYALYIIRYYYFSL